MTTNTARSVAGLLAWGLTICAATAASAQLVPRNVAQRYGMDRAWFTQVEIDRGRSRVVGLTLHRGTLFALSNSGALQSIDAETGKTHWAIQVGDPEHPSMGPAANDDVVAILNGSNVFVVDRENGRMLWSRQTVGGPGAGPALTQTRCFVPMINGMIQAFDLTAPRQPAWNYFSHGRTLFQPRASQESVFWPTDKGYLYVSRAELPEVRFRVEMKDEISNVPGYRKPYIFAAAHDGYVVAIHELSGNQVWRFSTGDPITDSPVAVEDRVFVCPVRAGMYCIDAKTGKSNWWASDISKFLAASPDRVFGTDGLGRLFILDIKTGSRIATAPIPNMTLLFSNYQTDRLYLGTDSGLIQCLHDINQPEPVNYVEYTDEDKPAEPVEQQGLDDVVMPDAEPADPAGDADNPFGGGDDNPFGGGAADPVPADDAGGGDDNPFGGADDNPFGGGGDDNPFN